MSKLMTADEWLAAERKQLIRLRDRGIKAEKVLALIDKALERKSRLTAHQIGWVEQATILSHTGLEDVRAVNRLLVELLAELADG